MMKIGMSNRCFSLTWEESSAYLSFVDDMHLWHERLGHVNFQSFNNLQKHQLVANLPKFGVNNTVCEVCQLGKQCRLPFPPVAAWRASEKHQLVHTDICGPMKNPSLNDSRYFILFIDDLSRFSWIYFMKKKSEVTDVFWKFKAWIENQSSCKIKVLRSDNGKEYTSDQFREFLAHAGIEHQKTLSYSPQQNRVSERKNRSAMEMARCLLFEKELPKRFWAEAVNTAIYLQNRLPTKAVLGKTPFEAWFGYKPSVAHLKVFGCLCYTWIPGQKRGKLDSKAQVGVFVGYSNVSKGYRIYDPSTDKVYVSRDVKFNEAATWNW